MTNQASVLHKSRVPLYLQVAHLMRQKIERQDWPVDAQIPTLNELEQEFQVSRITLRESLARLEEEGLIRRTRGRGTFVMKDLSQQRWFKLATSFDELVRSVSELKIRLLAIDEDEHPLVPHFAAGKVVGPYRRLRRVHYRDDRPYCLIEIYLAQDVFALDPKGFSSTPVIPRLAALPQVRITGARQIMRVTMSDEETSAHLDIGVADPIADVCRSLQDAHGRIVYYAHIQYPAQMIQVEVDLFAGQPQPRQPANKKR